MEEMLREHDFIDGVCRWCGARHNLLRLLTCVPRWVEKRPRSTPTSVFADLASIGERMREMQAGERRCLPGDEQ